MISRQLTSLLAIVCLATVATGAAGRTRTADLEPPRAHYSIDCRIDPTSDLVEGTEVIRLTNSQPHQISQLTFDWVLDSDQHAEITVGGRTITPLGVGEPEGCYSLLHVRDVRPVLFDLPKPVKRGERLEVRLRFSRKLGEWGFDAGYLMTGWHPRLWWGFPTDDDFSVKLDVPAGYTIGTSGRLDAKGRYTVAGAKSFGVLLARGCVTETIADEVQIRCIYTPKGAECAKLLVKTAVDVIAFYRERFGFYPHSSLTIIPGADRPMGGWWVATAIAGVHGLEQMDKATELHWKWITAHEIGHMYWGDWVLEKDSPDWLWIGLGIYADREYVRARGLDESEHRGLIDCYVNGVRQGVDTTVDRPAEQLTDIDFDHNNIVVHGKGFSIISALCCTLGKETFERAYMRCLRDYAGRRLGCAEFQRVCEEESGQDLGWFFDQWVRSNRCLSYEIASRECKRDGDSYRTTVGVECKGTLRMPVPVEALFEDGSRQVKSTERLLADNVIVFESASPLKEVRIDPKGELANIVPPPADSAQVMKTIDKLPWTGAGDDALVAFKSAKEAKLRSLMPWFKLGLILYDGKHYTEAAEAFANSCAASGNKRGGFRVVGLVWQGHLADLLGEREKALQFYREALAADKGTNIRHDQYGMVINRSWIEERLKTPFERK